jgi:glycosyltransferase involved in cell wall biosynthesis
MSEPRVSFVVIGLNEAPHLEGSIGSIARQGIERGESEILYVDSGSGDGSADVARGAGADRILSAVAPGERSCAARARNTGLAEARGEYVHFVDGDTQLAPGWTSEALAVLEREPSLAGVEGHLREAQGGTSWLHAVCELDWLEQRAGTVGFVGGNSLYRRAAIAAASGFRPDMVLGEEPELGARMRAQGWEFAHIDRVMAYHDLDLHGLRDYWLRGYKGGLSCGLVHRATGGAYWGDRVRHTLALATALVGPLLLAALLAAWLPTGASAAIALASPLLVLALAARKARQMLRKGIAPGLAAGFGVHTYFSKIPAALGIAAAYWRPRPRRGAIAAPS